MIGPIHERYTVVGRGDSYGSVDYGLKVHTSQRGVANSNKRPVTRQLMYPLKEISLLKEIIIAIKNLV